MIKIAIISFFFLASCNKDSLEPDKVIKLISDNNLIQGNGKTKITLHAYISYKSEKSNRIIEFSCSDGSFEGSNGEKKISKNANIVTKFENESKWEALANFIVPAKTGEITITAKIKDISSSVKINLTKLEADSIFIESPFSVFPNFLSEIKITGKLWSQNGIPSAGTKVIFIDEFDPSGIPVNGARREEHYLSDENGNVSIIYSPGPILPNQYIKISAIILDENGNQTSKRRFKRIYINQP